MDWFEAYTRLEAIYVEVFYLIRDLLFVSLNFFFLVLSTCSSSKWTSLTNDYWADPLPIIDSSLCAVIDPVRDYRWHALHCGGPETAAFLCEMEGN